MATGLEQQLIYGAGQAAQSHQDIIGRGMDKAIKGVTEGVEEVATKLGDIHQAKLDEEEELKQEQEDLVKDLDLLYRMLGKMEKSCLALKTLRWLVEY